jgi:hypothetical protein
MGKSKGPRVRKRPGQPEPIPPKEAAEKPTFWTRTKKVVAAFTTVAGLLTSIVKLYSGTIPDIQLTGQDASPFVLPYSVRNTSWLFDMTDVVLFCGPRPGQNIQVGPIVITSGVRFQDSVQPVTMKPGQLWYFRCPISNASGRMVKGTIHPTIEYRTLGIKREFEGLDQTWFADANPPRWVQGQPAPPQ